MNTEKSPAELLPDISLDKKARLVSPPNQLSVRLFPRSSKSIKAIDNYLSEIRSLSAVGLNLGCGDHPVPGLINCDLYSDSADLKLDVTDLQHFKDEAVDLIEAHHLFEHLSFTERALALIEWSRVLRTGGRLVLSVPDLTSICWKWLRMYYLGGFDGDQQGVPYVERMLFGPQNAPGMFHRSGYGRRTLVSLLSRFGFDNEFYISPYPKRPTPSLFVVSVKRNIQPQSGL